MSPATAGNVVTFSSPAVLSTVTRSYSKVLVPVAPLSRMPRSLYCCDTPGDGSRSEPVPVKMYCCVPPTFTVAIDAKIGCFSGSSYSFVGLAPALNCGTLLSSSEMSKRQSRPSRSPMYDLVMNLESDGPVATGSECSAFLNWRQSLDGVGAVLVPAQLSCCSYWPSLPTLLEARIVPVWALNI